MSFVDFTKMHKNKNYIFKYHNIFKCHIIANLSILIDVIFFLCLDDQNSIEWSGR